MSKFSIAHINSFVAHKTRLDKDVKHNCAEIIKGSYFLNVSKSLNPYLSMQSRVILFKKLDLWQAQYHSYDVIRVSGFGENNILVPKTLLSDMYGFIDSKRDKIKESFLKKTKLSEDAFEIIRLEILALIKFEKSNEEAIAKEIDSEHLSEILEYMTATRDLLKMEPLGWQGDNFKFDLFSNYLENQKITAPEVAVKKVVINTFKKFCPMTVEDISNFTGVEESKVKDIITETDPVEISIDGLSNQLITKDDLNHLNNFSYAKSRIIVNLLPHSDTYLNVYKNSSRYGEFELEGNDNAVLVNGELIGKWDLKEKSIRIEINTDDMHTEEHVVHEARFLPNLFGQEAADWDIKIIQ